MSRLSQLLLLALLVFPAALLLGDARGGPGEGGRAAVTAGERGWWVCAAVWGDLRGAAGRGSRSGRACGSSAERQRRRLRSFIAPAARARGGRPAAGAAVPAGPGPVRGAWRMQGRAPAPPARPPAVSGRAPRAPASGPAVTAARESRRARPGAAAAGLSFSPHARGAGSTFPSRCAGCHPAFPPRLPPPPECPWRHRGALISVYAAALSDSRSGNCLPTTKFGKAFRPAPAVGCSSGRVRVLSQRSPAIATSSAPLTSIGNSVRGLRVCWAADGKGCLQPICMLFIFNLKPPASICKNFCSN